MKIWKKVLKIWKEDFLFHSMFLGGIMGGLATAIFGYALGKNVLAILIGVGIGLILIVSLYTIVSLLYTIVSLKIQRNK